MEKFETAEFQSIKLNVSETAQMIASLEFTETEILPKYYRYQYEKRMEEKGLNASEGESTGSFLDSEGIESLDKLSMNDYTDSEK